MITRKDVEGTAADTGFSPDVVEKVLRLHGILERLARHELARGEWLLKGGTALNLLHLDVPRLSVDIDVNYVGAADVAGMLSARPGFDRALAACCAREGCDVRRAPSEHAGGKFRLRYASVVGGSQRLEVDVSYVARVPLWGATSARMRFPPGSGLDVPTLTIEELAAGKFAALLQRSVVRDAFDAANLLGRHPDLLARKSFRVAFVCLMAGSRFDAREVRPPAAEVPEALIARDLDPLLRRRTQGSLPTPAELREWIVTQIGTAAGRLLAWSDGEQRFLDALLDRGEIAAEALHEDTDVQDRIRRQPMLQWKAQHVRERRGEA